jgi:heme O synthase-like polyprenyltransferase
MGWTAARGVLSSEGWSLFAILACWQLPHFFAIAWICREDYARAGYRMLPAFDPLGRRTARQALLYSLVLLPVSAGPYFLDMVHITYLPGAALLGALFVWQAARFRRRIEPETARALFLISIAYLPALLALMVATRN